jgi:hypothetical protein
VLDPVGKCFLLVITANGQEVTIFFRGRAEISGLTGELYIGDPPFEYTQRALSYFRDKTQLLSGQDFDASQDRQVDVFLSDI